MWKCLVWYLKFVKYVFFLIVRVLDIKKVEMKLDKVLLLDK